MIKVTIEFTSINEKHEMTNVSLSTAFKILDIMEPRKFETFEEFKKKYIGQDKI